MLAHGGDRRRKVPEKPKVVGSALLWCFNPGQLWGGARGHPRSAGWELAVVMAQGQGRWGGAAQLEMGQLLLLA